ncbi:3-oxoacyl-ACP synthase [Lutibacter sp. TH_r2]|uniref:3-oxoacyl-ACP synthase n=1 Tax=Lutibacter sp. TH_r2 TaxID=3082083 RepID=UPI00295524A0|nr:3-oxoacyl-ACP synthase [Lutibacter sp. TH_r2]MDV7186612.1 3-oxoacyl-ACP synthase [Lutibacter sp. TH_r2]
MKSSQKIKEQLLQKCIDFVSEKESTVLETIASNKRDLFSETKSSAGDKHETGRAMIQLEMEKASQQLSVINEMKETLKRVSFEENFEVIKLGSLVKTTKGTYFLAISVGQVRVENDTYFVVSTQSPIGKQLLGKRVGEIISFNSAEILEVV